MNVKNRLAIRLISWLVIVGLLLSILGGVALFWIIDRLTQIEANRQFENAGLYQLIQTLESRDGQLYFDPQLIELIRESGGWLQRLDETGKATDSFFTPDDVPRAYGPGELTAYWLGKSPFPYQLFLWIQEKDGVQHTLVYGVGKKLEQFLKLLVDKAAITGDQIAVAPELADRVRSEGAWLQLLDEKGKELASFNKPAEANQDFSLQELALRSVYPDRYGTKLVSYYDKEKRQTWVLSTPLAGMKPGQKPLLEPEIQVLLIGLGSLLAGSMLVILVVAYWLGQRFGAPIVHMMKWLTYLRSGRYAEPAGANGVARSMDKRGRRKRNYRVYQDVMDSLDSLSQSLHRNEKLREETERIRDEWIAGVSHDLKTPLSSIKGYAHLLGNEAYSWSAEETRSFAEIILDKSAYLDDLINDLTLTYRLRNGQEAPAVELVELNSYTGEVVREVANHPAYAAGSIRFDPAAETSLYIHVYKPWFQRIVENLVANALLHNEAGTNVTIGLRQSGSSTVQLTFADNGKGIDEETAERLFERYFRGTDTETRGEGSGLGMAITKALVEALGGSIEVETAKGQGTVISITWKTTQPPSLEKPAGG
ncbi:histidine kinase [Brevibacillus parabrevis]|uniref:sensor histidine kinase n=1 Tax=Brevibacillus parabrevis TaxID=54914 RepID=UPI0007ABF2A9|nr:HAMP domain-containing sensor histidine kinase [Brevibacillus parabrevis]KZE47108.1 histidine kinase [Brevibacillus parabrevis]